MILKKDPKQTSNDPRIEGERLLTRKLAWTKRAIFMENFWLRLWAPASVIALFLLACLFELWPHLSPLAHRVVLALFLLGFLASLYTFFSLRWPKEDQALKRLDNNGTLPHHPAQAFKDNLSPDLATAETRNLWVQFKQRLVEKIKQLRIPLPSPNTAQKDPYALRMVLLLGLAAGLFIQGGNIGPLLSQGLTPPPMVNLSNMRVDAWVTPPSYTGEPPLLITDGSKELVSEKQEDKKTAFTVPENSILTIRVNGKKTDQIILDSPNNEPVAVKAKKRIAPNALKTTRDFHIKLKQNGAVSLQLDQIPLSRWQFDVTDDAPPIIGLIETPNRAQSGALKLKYRVVDDYGVMSAKAQITNLMVDGKPLPKNLKPHEVPLGSPPNYPLNLSEIGTKSGEGETFKDLTRHPWAGLVGTLVLSATDEGGNTSNSPELKLEIPAYKFTKPMAKNIIRLRKQLILTPHESAITARLLYNITANKEPFEKDLGVYLGLRVASLRLRKARTRQEKEELAEFLYELARHVEDGDLSRAERELRSAQEALRKALQENASAEEIQKRVDELRKALEKYMQELAKRQQKQDNHNGSKNSKKSVNSKNLEQMLKTIEELAKSGSKDLARKMLSQMQNMLENLQTGKNQQNQQQTETAKQLQELGELLRKQQELMDRTFTERRQQNNSHSRPQNNNQGQRDKQRNDLGQKGQQGQKPQHGKTAHSLEKDQEALRKQLEKLLQQMKKSGRGGQNSKALQGAKRAMGKAQKMLQQNNLTNALSQEGQALNQLRSGMEQLSQEMGGQKSGQGGGRKQSGKDPLGRPSGRSGLDTSQNTKVPDKIDIQRAREILRDLQEKASDPKRPTLELDYFERLLKRF